MSDTRNTEFDLDALMRRIRADVAQRRAAAGRVAAATDPASARAAPSAAAPPLDTSALPRPPESSGSIARKDRYALAEFLAFQDEDFVRNAYRGILRREPDAVLDYYNAMIAVQEADYQIRQTEISPGRAMTRSGTSEARIEDIELLVAGTPTRAVRIGEPVIVRVVACALASLPSVTAGILIRDRFGNDVYGTNTFHLGVGQDSMTAGDRMTLDFRFTALNVGVGSYSITVALHARDTHTTANYDWWDRALVFQVTAGDQPLSIGVCALDASAQWARLPASSPQSANRLGSPR